MSIKTSELQQLQSILGTDSLLADTAAAGTGRLSLARAAEFFGAELVKPANPVGAALSAQETVEKTAASNRTVELTAEEAPGYIASLPRLLTENYSFSVSGGTVDALLAFRGFYGPGRIWFETDGSLILNKGLMIHDCSAYIRVIKPKVRGAVPGENALILVRNSPVVSLEQLDVDAAGISDVSCVYAGVSTVALGSCVLKNGVIAAQAAGGAVIAASNVSGSGNTIGGRVYGGGVLMLSGSTPDLLGGTVHSKLGGLIVKSDGTLL